METFENLLFKQVGWFLTDQKIWIILKFSFPQPFIAVGLENDFGAGGATWMICGIFINIFNDDIEEKLRKKLNEMKFITWLFPGKA